MKKLKQLLTNLWDLLINFKKIREFKKWQKQIAKGILDKNREKIRIMGLITKEIKAEKYRKQTSKYIPLTRKNNAEIKAMVEHQFGNYMKHLQIVISQDLKFV